MAKVTMKASIPEVSRGNEYRLEVDARADGRISIVIPKQPVSKGSSYYIPFAEIASEYPAANINSLFNEMKLNTGIVTARTVSGRRLQVRYNPKDLREAVLLALTADYC